MAKHQHLERQTILGWAKMANHCILSVAFFGRELSRNSPSLRINKLIGID